MLFSKFCSSLLLAQIAGFNSMSDPSANIIVKDVLLSVVGAEAHNEGDDNDDDDETLFLVAFARFVADGAEGTSEELPSSGTSSSSQSSSRSRFSVTCTVDILICAISNKY